MPRVDPHRVATAGLLSFAVLSLDAQNTSLEPGRSPCALDDGITPYADLREADVAWERRVWRMVDLRDPSNRLFNSPSSELAQCLDLFGVIRHGLLNEEAITAYDPGPLASDDTFRTPFAGSGIRAIIAALDTVPENRVGRYVLKEDWIFDKQRSVMEVRIIGLAPMVGVLGEDGELRGYRTLFWLYYPECRQLFSRWAAAQGADERPVSYEALFALRRFASTIIKVSNVFDRAINEHKTTLDALMESGTVREQVIHLGFDLWNY
ncbi:MAG TPA: gliding motility protein GldN [Flavobacteriales bacterium]|nr:gliding motility protein GldN [Flavobacteriales bacterium]